MLGTAGTGLLADGARGARLGALLPPGLGTAHPAGAPGPLGARRQRGGRALRAARPAPAAGLIINSAAPSSRAAHRGSRAPQGPAGGHRPPPHRRRRPSPVLRPLGAAGAPRRGPAAAPPWRAKPTGPSTRPAAPASRPTRRSISRVSAGEREGRGGGGVRETVTTAAGQPLTAPLPPPPPAAVAAPAPAPAPPPLFPGEEIPRAEVGGRPSRPDLRLIGGGPSCLCLRGKERGQHGHPSPPRLTAQTCGWGVREQGGGRWEGWSAGSAGACRSLPEPSTEPARRPASGVGLPRGEVCRCGDVRGGVGCSTCSQVWKCWGRRGV